MSIRHKLFLGFGILVVLAILQGGLAVRSSQEAGKLVTRTYDKSLMSINFVRSAQSNFLMVDRKLAPALQGTAAALRSVTVDEIVKTNELVLEDLDVAKERSLRARSVQLIDKVMALNRAWIKTASDGLKKLATLPDPAGEAAVLRKDLSAQSKAILEALVLLVEYASEDGYTFSMTARNQVERTVRLNLAASGAVAMLGLIIAGLLGTGISRPLNRMRKAMNVLAEGDKTVDIPGVNRRDEVGDMARAMGVFKDSLVRAEQLEEQGRREREAAREAEARRQQKEREVEQMELQQRTFEENEQRERVARKDEIIAAFDKTINGVIQTLASATTMMKSSAETMSATTSQANHLATAVAAASEEATANVQTTASSAEDLYASIQEISRQVTQSNQIAQNAVEKARQTNEKVEGLADAAQKIGEVVNLINDIASQTNLLALNATIEAARAGEAGKGFAVVASEVKSLATQTGKATEEIGAQIASIQAATTDAVQAIKDIGSTIGQLGEIATSVATAVTQQGSATRDIASSVQQAAAGTQDVSSNISQVTEAAMQSQSASDKILSAVDELARQGDVLRGEVDRFLADVRAA
jgi:methyl-accepting chemotaxis protein